MAVVVVAAHARDFASIEVARASALHPTGAEDRCLPLSRTFARMRFAVEWARPYGVICRWVERVLRIRDPVLTRGRRQAQRLG